MIQFEDAELKKVIFKLTDVIATSGVPGDSGLQEEEEEEEEVEIESIGSNLSLD